MYIITLPNGNKFEYSYPVSTIDVAYDVDNKLVKFCVAGIIDNKLIDVVDLIKKNTKLSIVTINDKNSLYVIRCSCAYLLGCAVKQLWSNAQLSINFVTENGFYYDIDLNYKLSEKDLKKIENVMYKLINKNYDIVKKKVNWNFAYNLFVLRNEKYKINILENKINKNDYLNLYYYGDYVDFCRGPHVPKSNFCYNFKLQKISGAYWNSSKKNKMLQRIYGTAWSNEEQLKQYLSFSEEVVKRDHRLIGKQLNLFHINDETPGMVFWHNDGLVIFKQLESFIRKKLTEYNYQEVKTPLLMNYFLWEKTGHLNNFYENMFITQSENNKFCIKPMNCPGHIEIFKQEVKSYRNLPLRIAEFGNCHRNEPSGSLHGLMRTRSFTQDDAHIFCTKNQVFSEVNNCIKMIFDIYNTFGFKNILVKLSTRPKKYIGDDLTWSCAINDLVNVLKKNSIDFEYQLEAGAFYGPKIEFILFDCLNRAWQCGTIQLDFIISKLLNIFYIKKNNEKDNPVIIHRAILGSIERFLGILTEEYAGFYPTWLAPTQVVIMNIKYNHIDYVNEIAKKMLLLGIRVKTDLRNEKINFKIRENILRKIPYMVICGDNEVRTKSITIRTYRNKNIRNINVDEMIIKLKNEIFNYNIN